MGKYYATWLVLLTTASGFAGASSAGALAHGLPPVISVDAEGILKVVARELPRAQVIEAVARYTNLQVHSGTVPDARLTVTCTARDVESLFACIVGRDASLIFGYPNAVSSQGARVTPNEVWILGNQSAKDGTASAPKVAMAASDMRADEEMGESLALLASHAAQGSRGDTATGSEDNSPDTHSENAQDWADVLPAVDTANSAANAATTPMLIDLANSTNSVDRVQALSRLAIDGKTNDPSVSTMLEVALNDVHPDVRAQAVHALLSRNDPRSAVYIETAMRDENSDVRLMVVESAGSNPSAQTWLRRALTDPDATVREVAALKLKETAQAAPVAQSTMR